MLISAYPILRQVISDPRCRSFPSKPEYQDSQDNFIFDCGAYFLLAFVRTKPYTPASEPSERMRRELFAQPSNSRGLGFFRPQKWDALPIELRWRVCRCWRC